MSSRLPELIRRPGLHSWVPTVEKEVNISFSTYEAFIDSLLPDKKTETKMTESHWPPTNDEAKKIHLDRWRVSLQCLFGNTAI